MSGFASADFSDRLSPIVVKELRQGLRSRSFVGAFLLMQTLMIFCVIIGLVTTEFGGADFSRGLFWAMVAIPLLLVMPARALNALGGEIKANTLELVFLTRLSASRIVFGKWAALVLQTVLLITAVLPYAVLRYFLGEINLLEEMIIIGWMILGSALLTAVVLAASPYQRSLGSRVILGVALMFFLQFGIRLGVSVSGAPGGQSLLLSIVVIAPLLLLLLLQIAISKIAPPAENHSTRKRVVGLLLMGIPVGLRLAGCETEFLENIGALLLLAICLEALCEEVKGIPSIYQPFVRYGAPGKFVGRFLYPGWPAGVLYTLLVIALAHTIMLWRNSRAMGDGLSELALIGSLFLPLAISRMFFPRQRIFVVYLVVLGVMASLAPFLAPLRHTPLLEYIRLALPFPFTALLLEATTGIPPLFRSEFIKALVVVASGSLLLLVFKMRPALKEITKLEESALTLSQPKNGA